jgi:hypothetical protein
VKPKQGRIIVVEGQTKQKNYYRTCSLSIKSTLPPPSFTIFFALFKSVEGKPQKKTRDRANNKLICTLLIRGVKFLQEKWNFNVEIKMRK